MDAWLSQILANGCLAYLAYVCFAVVMATDSDDSFTNNTGGECHCGNTTGQNTSQCLLPQCDTASIAIPECPPPDRLHLLCDLDLAADMVSCEQRTSIMDLCFVRFGPMYNGSDWRQCVESDSERGICCEIVHFLNTHRLINETVENCTVQETTLAMTSAAPSSSTSRITTSEISSTSPGTPSTSPGATSTSPRTPSTSPGATSTSPGTPSTSPGATSTSPRTPSTSTETKSPSTVFELRPYPLSWVYPMFGVFLILLEICALCFLFCYRKRKTSSHRSPGGPYRRTSTGSMVLKEELIVPDTNPGETQSMSPSQGFDNKLFSDDTTDAALGEDEKIFRSYANLRFIDESSAEGTPVRRFHNVNAV